MSRTHYSEVYYRYGLAYRYGLSPIDGKWLTDTYWPSILGETGFLGIAILALCYVSVIRNSFMNLKRCEKSDSSLKCFGYVCFFSFIALIIESFMTSTFFSLRCYLGLGMLGIFNHLVNLERYNEKNTNI